MEFACLYGICELLRLEKIPETHVLATLLMGNAWLFNVKMIFCIAGMNKLFLEYSDFGGVCRTDLMANLHETCATHRFSKPKMLK